MCHLRWEDLWPAPPKCAAPCAKGPEVKAPGVSGTPVPKAAGADALSDGGSGECAPANSEITHPRPEVPPRKAVKSLSEPAKPGQAEPPPKRGGSVPDVAGGDIPQPEDSTPSLSTDASMGMASHPEAPKPAGQDAQPDPADAGAAKGA